MLVRRLFLKYLIYDVSPIAVYAIFGSLLLGFATSFGGYHWWQSIRTGIPSATGTTVVALLTFLMGYMLLLQAVNLDTAQSPRLREPARGVGSRCGDPALQRPPRCSRRTTRLIHNRMTSSAVRAMRPKLKNWDTPYARW